MLLIPMCDSRMNHSLEPDLFNESQWMDPSACWSLCCVNVHTILPKFYVILVISILFRADRVVVCTLGRRVYDDCLNRFIQIELLERTDSRKEQIQTRQFHKRLSCVVSEHTSACKVNVRLRLLELQFPAASGHVKCIYRKCVKHDFREGSKGGWWEQGRCVTNKCINRERFSFIF